MSTLENKQSIDIPVSCSCVLKVFYICLFVFLFVVVSLLSIPLLAKFGIAVLAISGIVAVWRQVRFLNALSQINIRDGRLELIVDGEPLQVKIVGRSVVTELLIAFSCCQNGSAWSRWTQPLHLVLLPDSMSGDNHRKLRVLLNSNKMGQKPLL